MWSTHTDFDVMHEKRVDDFWNVDSNTSLTDSWKGFTKFLLKEKLLKGYFVVRELMMKNLHFVQPVRWAEDT